MFSKSQRAEMEAKTDADLRGIIEFAAIGYMAHQADIDAAADLAREILATRNT